MRFRLAGEQMNCRLLAEVGEYRCYGLDGSALVSAYPDGPLIFRGRVAIVDGTGNVIPRRRRTIAVCRCGASAIAPYCDGRHRYLSVRPIDRRSSPPADRRATNRPSTPWSSGGMGDKHGILGA